MKSRKSKITKLAVFRFEETEGKVLVGIDSDDRAGAVWLLKSQIEISEKAIVNGIFFHDLSLLTRFAREKGLIQ